jgi:PST family polysaccharide transporter
MFLLTGSMAAKVASILTQIALAWLLSENDYGVVALALTITAFVQVIEQAGIVDVLVQRRNFRAWAVPGFWLALTLGIASGLLVILCAPIASRIYRSATGTANSDTLFWALLVLAAASIPNSLMAVPRAALLRNMRFRAFATISVAFAVLRMALTVLFAALEFGPYSFVLPVPITSAATAMFLWWWVRPPWSRQMRPERWRYLIGDSTRALGGELGRVALDQSDYILLGLFRSVTTVGFYKFGFDFSIQMMQVFAGNLMNILFPALTKLNDQPEAQYQGFLKAQRILAMLGISSCLLQAAVAEPLAHLVFAPRWQPAIVVMQVLCLGMATRMVAGSSFALLKSVGHFHTIFWNRLVFCAIQVTALLIVLTQGGELKHVAITVAAISTIIGPVTFYTAVRLYGRGWPDVAAVLVRPAICGLVAVGGAWWIARQMAAAEYGDLPQLVVTIVVAVAANVFLAWFWMRPVCIDLLKRLRHVLPQRVSAYADSAMKSLT